MGVGRWRWWCLVFTLLISGGENKRKYKNGRRQWPWETSCKNPPPNFGRGACGTIRTTCHEGKWLSGTQCSTEQTCKRVCDTVCRQVCTIPDPEPPEEISSYVFNDYLNMFVPSWWSCEDQVTRLQTIWHLIPQDWDCQEKPPEKGECDYQCTRAGGCEVRYVGPPRAGKIRVIQIRHS